MVHHFPEFIALGDDIVFKLVLQGLRQPGGFPIGAAVVVSGLEICDLGKIGVGEFGKFARLEGEHVGFDHKQRRRQNIGNQILAVDDLLVNRPVDLEPFERRLLQSDRHEKTD
ncbi:hypothetical protein ABIA10_005651 [Rhizobium leguminosarum]